MITLNKSVFHKEALLFDSLDNSKVQCKTCWHQCNIPKGKLGRCHTRMNVDGGLYCLNYGLISSFSVNPIEKKPLFHYFPGTYASTVGSYSCNFSCPWCQNWSISKVYPSEVHVPRYLSPEDLVDRTESDPKIDGISISFNEPTLSLEYALDVFRLCKSETYRMFVTNGYMTPYALKLLIQSGMTGMSVTVKGNAKVAKKYCGINVEKVWENIKMAIDQGVHVEVICLIIPTVNDSVAFFTEVGERINDIDPEIPLHFTRFHPDYQFTEVDPTSVTILEEAHSIARSIGLKYVYLGNVFTHPLENTYCPNCQVLLIKRTGYQIEKKFDLKTNRCPSCALKIPIYKPIQNP
ncbi:MAG: AmmeMemoRadiSam system radical SAM enzyme [Candidatus Hodarchaeota archaeon]